MQGEVAADDAQLTDRRRYGILGICCMSLLMVGIDVTIVNVALPSIGHDLHTSVAGLQWIVDAYTLMLASLLMLSGSMGDRFGRRRTFQLGLSIFAIGSLLCSLAPTIGVLIAARALQAVGGSMLNPVALSIITNTFTTQKDRAQAIGIWGAVVGVSLALGPIVGGALVDSVGWRAIFWINIPVGIAAVVLTGRYVPESKAPHARRTDPVGQILVIVLFASLTFGVIEGHDLGWASAGIVAAFVLSVLSLGSLSFYERRHAEPLIDSRFFKSAPFSGAMVIAVCAFAALAGFLFINTLYLQEVRGQSPFHAGLDTLPMAAMTFVVAPLSGRVVGATGARIPLVVGGVGITTAAVMLAQVSATTSFTWLFVAYFCFGTGFGAVNAPISNAAVSGMPREQAGVAGGLASTSRQVGASLGVAVVGTLAASRAGDSLAHGLAAASHPGWWTIAGCGLAVLAVGLAVTSPWASRTATSTAALLMPEGQRA